MRGGRAREGASLRRPQRCVFVNRVELSPTTPFPAGHSVHYPLCRRCDGRDEARTRTMPQCPAARGSCHSVDQGGRELQRLMLLLLLLWLLFY